MEPFQLVNDNVPRLILQKWTRCNRQLSVGISAKHHYSLHRPNDDPQEVIHNRKQLVEELGFTLDSWTCADQVHGKNVVFVSDAERGAGSRSRESAIQATDGLVTNENDILLTAFFADCVPLFFWDSVTGAIGIAHAGWKGTVAGIAREMVRVMTETFGTDSRNLNVAIGPSIGVCCYEVDERVINVLKKELPVVNNEIVQPATKPEHYFLDLKQANATILTDAGVLSERILVTKYCTCCYKGHFFSYRRDNARAGRMVAWIGKKEFE